MRYKKKRIQRMNYGRSSRHKMVSLMLEFGLVTTAGLKVLDGSLITYQRMLTRLKKEGVASSVGTRCGGMGTYLVDVANKGSEYLRSMGPMSFYAYNESKGLIEYAWRSDDVGKKKRAFRTSEVAMMFYASDIPTRIQDKIALEDMDKENRVASYYSLRECKKYYEQIKGVALEHNANARMLGVYNTSYDIYPVYKAEEGVIKAYSSEQYACNLLQEIFLPDIRLQGLPSCIFFYEEDKVASSIISPNPKWRELTTNLITSKTDYYDHIYLMSYSRESRELLQRMSAPDWRSKLIQEVIPTEHLAKKSPVEYADAFYDNCLEYVFCIPDAKVFSRFLTLAKQRQRPELFRIYCYPHQEALVRSLLSPRECQVVVVS